MTSPSSDTLDSYLPVYDAIPEKWEEARPFLVERMKEHANSINIREIGWFLDEELLSGKQFIPPANVSGQSDQYRSIFRKVIDCSPLVIGVNTFPHGITIDNNFTLMQLYAAATDNVALIGEPIPNGPDTISYDVNNIIITVASAWPRCFAVIEYIQEL